MKMFIANCTNQVQEFRYRVPGNPSPRTQVISIGGQVQISGELQPEDVDAIVAQHSIYGMFAATSVAQTHAHIHLLYSVGKPISTNQMQQALERNLVLMNHKGERLRQEAAVAVNTIAQENNPNEFKHVDFEIVEQPKDGGTPLVNEAIKWGANGRSVPPPTPDRSSRRNRKAA